MAFVKPGKFNANGAGERQLAFRRIFRRFDDLIFKIGTLIYAENADFSF